jgi:hypothetical protein
MTTALFIPWCVQLEISSWDLELLIIGLVNEMYIVSGNDEVKDAYSYVATQADFDEF